MKYDFRKKRVLLLVTGILLSGLFLLGFKSQTQSSTGASGNYAGQISAVYSVDGNGNGNYSIPLLLPPGTAKMNPTLSITYNTIQENGLMGVGWKLLGLSQITRVQATQAQDGFFSYLNYDTTDRYSLDGQRLMLVQGTYAADSAVFHTQVESWSRVVGYNHCGSGFCAFRVYMKNGLIRDYAAKVNASGSQNVRVWALSKVTDRNGNYMTFDYTIDNNNSSYYPATITYTQNTGITQYHYVRFSYEQRPDSVPVYQGGSMIKYTKRLSAVNAYIGNTLAMSYNIKYRQGISTGKSQVDSVIQTAGDGGSLSPITVLWQGQDSSFYNRPVSSTAAMASTGLNLPMDVNGDGRIDYVHAWQGQGGSQNNKLMLGISISNGSSLGTPTIVNTNLNTYTNYMPLRPMDVNGDGMIDLVYVVQSSSNKLQYTVMLSNGTGFAVNQTVTTGIAAFSLPNNIVSLDVNGDGKSDMVFPSQSSSNYLQYQVMLSNGQSFDTAAKVTTTVRSYTNFPNLVPAHINNDPFEDLVYGYSSGNTKLIVVPLISTGTSYVTNQPILNTSNAQDQYTHLMPADMNGDGLSDLIVSWQQGSNIKTAVYYSNGLNYAETGNSYTQPSFPVAQATIVPMEINGDHKVDLMYSYSDKNGNLQLTPYISNGLSFNKQSDLPSPGVKWSQFGMVPADINGDAKSDMVNLASSGSSNAQMTSLVASQPYPDLASTISNGIGGNVSIRYLPITDPSVYTRQPVVGTLLGANNLFNNISGATYPAGVSSQGVYSGAGASFPVVNEIFPMYVVAGYTQYDGIGGAYPYGFRYSGAKIDLSGYGWLGFASKTLIDANTNTLDSTIYNQLFPLTGTVQSSSKMRLSDKSLLSRNRAVFSQSNPVPGVSKLYQVLQTQTRTDQYTYGTFNLTIGNNYRYDNYGNVTLLTELNDTAQPANTVYTIQQYTYNTAAWQLGLLTLKKTARDTAGNNYFTWSRSGFDPTTWELLSEDNWVSGNTWVGQTYTHDKYGNRTNVVYNGTDTTTLVYDNTYHIFPVQIIQPPNMQGRRLAYNYTYNQLFGKLQSKTDANGNTTGFVYDGMGNIRATYGPDPSGHTDTLTTSVNVAVSGGGYYTQTNVHTSWSNDSVHWVKSYKDGIGREYRITSEGSTPNLVKITDKVFNSESQQVRTSLPYYQGAAANTIMWARQEYDPYGRVVRISTPIGNNDSSITQVSYPDANTVNTLCAAGTKDSSRTIQKYNYYKSQRALVQSINGTKGSTTYQYDLLYRVTGSIDPLGFPCTIQYNGLGERTQMTDTTHGTTTYAYDYTARTMKQTYNNGRYVTNNFDKLWRVVKRASSDKDSSVYTYDQSSMRNGLGNLTSVTMSNGALYQYSYDAYRNKSGISLSYAGESYVAGQSYLPNNLPDKLTYPDGSVLQYQYTTDGIIKSMSLDDATDGQTGNFKQYVSYNNFTATGNPLSVNYANGATENYSWYNNGLVNTHLLSEAGGNAVVKDTFTWNYMSKVQNVRSGINAQLSQAYSYDGAGRLIGANVINGQNTYQYDSGGNMKAKNNEKFTYTGYFANYATVGQDTVFTAKYDNVGNMTSKRVDDTTYGYTFNANYDLTSVTINGKKAYNFIYDYNDNRLLKADSINKTLTLYVTPDYMVNIYGKGDSSVHTKYIVGPSGMVASVSTAAKSAGPWIRHQQARGKGMMQSLGLFGSFINRVDDWTSNPHSSRRIAWGILLGINLLFIIFFLYHYGKRNFWGRAKETLLSWHFWRRLPKAQLAIPLVFFAYTFAASGCSTKASPVFWTDNYGAGPYTAGTGGAVPVGAAGTTYYHQNLINSTTVTTNSAGTVQTMLSYLPFGEMYTVSGPDNVVYKFSNKELDGSGLYYFNARYYDADMCRFISADSQLGGDLTNTDVFNKYAYTLNDPTNYTDPTGHGVFSWFASLIVDILEIGAGIAIEALSGGSMTLLAQTLIGAGINGGIYTATHFSNFNWGDWGMQDAIGAVMGLAFAGIGAIGEIAGNALKAGTEAADITLAESGESAVGRLCMREVGANEEMAFQEMELDGASMTEAQCFVAGTKIVTGDGSEKNIEDIVPGDQVWSYNEKEQRSEVHNVVRLFHNHAETKVTVSLDNGTKIETTSDHPFHEKGKGWVHAKDIHDGDHLETLEQEEIAVTDVTITSESFDVYNFEVETAHTYYVSGSHVLVHNVCYTPNGNPYDVELQISESRWPESAKHISDAQKAGQPEVLTIDRGGASANRREWQSLNKYPTKSGFDRDEYPPAMFYEGGATASIRYISPWDNRSCGSFFGNFLRWTNGGGAWPNGTRVWFSIVP